MTTEQQRLSPRLGAHEFDRVVRSAAPLVAARPHQVLDILRDELEQWEAAGPPTYLERAAIEDTDQDEMLFGGAFRHVIVSMRAALLRLAETNDERLPGLLTVYLQQDGSALRRLALYVLTERPHLLTQVATDRILPASIYSVPAYHEEMRLIQVRFAELPPEIRARIRSVIVGGPAADAPQSHEDGEDANDRRAWRLLGVLPDDQLEEPERLRKEQLSTRYGGMPEHPLFLVWSSGVQMAKSPASAEDLRTFLKTGGLEKVLEVLRHPRDYFDFDWLASEDLVWTEYSQLVHEDPGLHLGIAERLTPSDLPDAWAYFEAYEKLARDGTSFDWIPLLFSMNRLVASGEMPRNGYSSIARLLREAASNRTVPIPASELPTLLETITTTLDRTATPIGDIGTIQNDLSFHQLNDPAGSAAEALLAVLFRRALDASTPEERTTNFPIRSRLDPVVSALLDRSLTELWGGVELRFAIGERLPTILWADKDWLTEQTLDQLLPRNPTDETDVGTWRAFWAGAFVARQVHDEIMRALAEQYDVLVRDATSEQPQIFGHMIRGHDHERLAEHLLIGWVRGYVGFGRDGLFGHLVNLSSDQMRGWIVFRLRAVLKDARTAVDDEWGNKVINELDDFWSDRSRVAQDSMAPGQQSKELSEFASWLEVGGWSIESIETRISLIVQHLELGLGFERVTNYLAAQVERAPETTTRILRLLIDRFIDVPQAVWYARDLPKLVGAAWHATNDQASRDTLRGIVSDLLLNRGIDLRGDLD